MLQTPKPIGEEETTMGWISRFRESGDTEPANPWDETVINHAPYDPYKVIRGGVEHGAAASTAQNANIPEEVKRRQVSLAVRFIAAMRAR
jgi:hypothetical protein